MNHLVIATTFSNLNSIEKVGEDGDITIFQNVKCESINANSIIIQKDTAPTVEFDSITADSLQNGGDLTVNSELQVTSIINQNKLTIADSVTAINQLSSILNDAELILNVDTSVEEITNNQNGIITVKEGKYLVVSKNMKDFGAFDGKVKFSGSEQQLITLKENTNYPHIVVDKDGGKITFTNAMTVGLFETEKSPETVFESNVSVGTFTDKADSGRYIFNKNASFATETIFNTTETVSFGSEENSTITFESTDNPVNFTHTAGKTLITGNLSANDVTLGETEISGTITANNITLEITEIKGDSELKINETATNGKITLNGNVISTGSKTLTLNGNVDALCSSINLNQGTLDTKGTFTAQNDLEINAICTFGNSVDADGNLTINGKANFANTVTTGNNLKIEGDEITINGAVIAGKSDPFTEGSILLTGITKITANSLSATKDITLNGNVIETAALNAAKDVTIEGTTI
ncbi:MAG: hypothetical protein IJ937_12680, partial [Treponema sp.]|nr:hypothetical protein [Treponema sp.]